MVNPVPVTSMLKVPSLSSSKVPSFSTSPPKLSGSETNVEPAALYALAFNTPVLVNWALFVTETKLCVMLPVLVESALKVKVPLPVIVPLLVSAVVTLPVLVNAAALFNASWAMLPLLLAVPAAKIKEPAPLILPPAFVNALLVVIVLVLVKL